MKNDPNHLINVSLLLIGLLPLIFCHFLLREYITEVLSMEQKMAKEGLYYIRLT